MNFIEKKHSLTKNKDTYSLKISSMNAYSCFEDSFLVQPDQSVYGSFPERTKQPIILYLTHTNQMKCHKSSQYYDLNNLRIILESRCKYMLSSIIRLTFLSKLVFNNFNIEFKHGIPIITL